MTRTSTERRPRSPRVTLRLAEDHYAFACEMAKRRGYLGPGDYLRSVLRHGHPDSHGRRGFTSTRPPRCRPIFMISMTTSPSDA